MTTTRASAANLSNSSEAGTTLAELILAVGILTFVIGSVTVYLMNAEKILNVSEIKKTQQSLHERLQVKARSPTAFAISRTKVPLGSNLRRCTSPQALCSFPTQAKDQQSFNLYDEIGPGQDERIAGTEFSPVYYDSKGVACRGAGAASRCPLKAVAYWWASCRNVGNLESDSTVYGGGDGVAYTSCYTPVSMHVRIQIQVNNAALNASAIRLGGRITEYPLDKDFDADPTAHSAAVEYSEIYKVIGSSCGDGQRIVGFDTDGRVKCECFVKRTTVATQSFEYDEWGRPLCGGQSCKNKWEVMTGFDNNGKIVCQSIKKCGEGSSGDENCPCDEIDLVTEGECPAGSWLARVDYGKCDAVVNTKDSTGKDIVECENDKGICCQIAL